MTVKAAAPELVFTRDSLGLLDVSEQTASLTIRAGSYDRLFYDVYTELPNGDRISAATERVSMSGSGGVSGHGRRAICEEGYEARKAREGHAEERQNQDRPVRDSEIM